MKKLLFCLLCIASFNYCWSQTTLVPEWSKIRTASNGGRAEAWGLDLDENGSVYWPISIDSLGQGLDIVCEKYDPQGVAQWATPFLYGGPGVQHAYVATYYDNSIYIGGRACPNFIQSCDMLLLKVDANDASLSWDATQGFSANGYEEVDGLVIEDEAIYCGGWAQEYAPDLYFTDVGLWKLDQEGNTDWTNVLGDSSTAEHQDGHFVVDEEFIYAAGLWGGTGLANLYNGRSFLAKYTKESGALVDSVSYGYPSAAPLDIENTLGMASDGEFLYLVGYSTPEVFNDWQILIAKFDKDLNLIWQKHWGAEGTESARGIAVVDDIIYIAGLTESASITQSNSREGLLLRFDTGGNYVSHQIWGDDGFNEFRDIVVSPDGSSIYLSGTTNTPNSGQPVAAFLLKIDNSINSIEEGLGTQEVTVYPNPSSGSMQLSWPIPLDAATQLVLTDVSGRHLKTYSLEVGSTNAEFELDQAAGIYLLSVMTKGRTWTKRIVVE